MNEHTLPLELADGPVRVCEPDADEATRLHAYLGALSQLDPIAYQSLTMGAGAVIPPHALEDEASEWWELDGTEALEHVAEALAACAPTGFCFRDGEFRSVARDALDGWV